MHPLAADPAGCVDVPDVWYGGRCPGTDQELVIAPTPTAVAEAEHLRAYLDARREAASGFSTRHLGEPAAGKMFGVMVCRDREGHLGTLRAFSGEWLGPMGPYSAISAVQGFNW